MNVVSGPQPIGFLARAYQSGLTVSAACKPRVLVRLFMVLGLVMAPVFAQAQTAGITGGASPAAMLNNICTFILGPFGQTLAVLGIIGCGLAWMFGRASMGVVGGVIGGIVIMFGASYLGQTLTGG